MYRKNNNIFTTMIANQLFSSYRAKHKSSFPFNTWYSCEDKSSNSAKFLDVIKQDSKLIQKERKESMLLLCLLEKTIEKRTKKIYKICENLEKKLSRW